jgi:hypothetical protein
VAGLAAPKVVEGGDEIEVLSPGEQWVDGSLLTSEPDCRACLASLGDDIEADHPRPATLIGRRAAA